MPRDDYKDRQGWINGMPRFTVEERTGCIAVIDVTKTDWRMSRGLHADSPGVVWFRMGEQHTHKCRECGQSLGTSWNVPPILVDEAVAEADKLNAAANSWSHRELSHNKPQERHCSEPNGSEAADDVAGILISSEQRRPCGARCAKQENPFVL